MKSRPIRNFGLIGDAIKVPNLIEVQRKSYSRFLQEDVAPNKRKKIGLEITFVHMGSKSLEIWYDNNYAPPYYCGVSRTMDSPKDWTLLGTAEGLSLWFRGSPNADQLYIRLKDSSDREALVKYTDFWDPANLVLEQWQQWKIDFGYFTDNNGDFDMTEVEMLEIGVGEPVGATPGVPYGGQIDRKSVV